MPTCAIELPVMNLKISTMPAVLRFIEPCLPSPADRPPSGSNWIHEIKHDGYRLMARRDSVGIRLITRRGNDWSDRFPLVVEAVNHLKVRSCLIDGEVVCCDERGLARFDVLRQRRNEAIAFLYAFDLLELDGTDLRREPIEVRKATLASILRKSRPRRAAERAPGARLRADGLPARLPDGAAKASSRSGSARATAPAARRTGSSSRTRPRQRSGARRRRIGDDDRKHRQHHHLRQIEFELVKAEHGMAMPYDAERVVQLRTMLVEARKRKLSDGLAQRRRAGR